MACIAIINKIITSFINNIMAINSDNIINFNHQFHIIITTIIVMEFKIVVDNLHFHMAVIIIINKIIC